MCGDFKHVTGRSIIERGYSACRWRDGEYFRGFCRSISILLRNPDRSILSDEWGDGRIKILGQVARIRQASQPISPRWRHRV
jgi:hypothetical protein